MIIKLTQSELFSENLESPPPDLTTTRSLLIVAATGLGKTVLMGAIAARWPYGRIMMISHRFEINRQATKTFSNICGEMVDLEQASYRADQCSPNNRCRIVVASVQTLRGKRLERFDPSDFGLLMIDEAHRTAGASYRRVIDHFFQNKNCKLLGVTATPDRLDKIGLGNFYDEAAVDLNIRWAIDNGWLTPIKQTFVNIEGLDFSAIKTTGGDLDNKQLAEVVEAERMLHEMAVPIIETAQGKSSLVFTASVAQAHGLAEIINRHKAGSAAAIDGKTPKPLREHEIKRYGRGELQMLINCGVFTEGFDQPRTELVAIARPTKSRALYTQMIGRGTRPLPGVVDGNCGPTAIHRKLAIEDSGKPFVRVLDFVGNAGRHKLVASGDILAGDSVSDEVHEAASNIQKRADFSGDVLEAYAEAKEQVRLEAEAARRKIRAGVKYSLRDVDIWSPLAVMPTRRVPGYLHNVPPSPKQAAFAEKLGYTSDEIEKMNTGECKQAIDYALKRRTEKLCTLRQARALAAMGGDPDTLFADVDKEFSRLRQLKRKRKGSR